MHPAELSSGLPEIPETFASKAAALAAARKLIREQRAAGREMFGVVSSETKQAINELRAQRAGFSVSPVAAGTWQLMHNGEMVGNTYPSLATCWKLAADIADREQRGEADPLMALAERAKRDRECEVRIREARIPAGADLSFEDISAEGEHNTRALTTLREYVTTFSTQGPPRHLIVSGCNAIHLVELRQDVKNLATGVSRSVVTRAAA